MYKITFELDSSVYFDERLNFDSLITWAYCKHVDGEVVQTPRYDFDYANSIDEELIPLKYENGVAVASAMYFDKEDVLEWVDYWRKSWCRRYTHFVDMESGKEINVSSGEFRSYEVPMNLKLVDKVWFYFDTDNLEFLEELIKHIHSLGKKRNRGKGRVKNYVIEKIDMNFFDEVRRPIPIRLIDMKKYEGKEFEIRQSTFKPPYWNYSKLELCVYPI